MGYQYPLPYPESVSGPGGSTTSHLQIWSPPRGSKTSFSRAQRFPPRRSQRIMQLAEPPTIRINVAEPDTPDPVPLSSELISEPGILPSYIIPQLTPSTPPPEYESPPTTTPSVSESIESPPSLITPSEIIRSETRLHSRAPIDSPYFDGNHTPLTRTF